MVLFLFCSSDFQSSMKLLMITAVEGSEVASIHGSCLGTYQHVDFREDNYPMWKLTSQSGSSCYLLHQEGTWVVKKNLNDNEWVFKAGNMHGHDQLPSSPILSWIYKKSDSDVYNEIRVTRPEFFARKF